MISSLRLTDIGLFIWTLCPFRLTYFDSSIKPTDFYSLFMKRLGNTEYTGCLVFVQHQLTSSLGAVSESRKVPFCIETQKSQLSHKQRSMCALLCDCIFAQNLYRKDKKMISSKKHERALSICSLVAPLLQSQYPS